MTHRGPFQPRTFCDSVIICLLGDYFVLEAAAEFLIDQKLKIKLESLSLEKKIVSRTLIFSCFPGY